MDEIRQEIAPFMQAAVATGEGSAEALRLGLCESCPLLNSMFNEIIRFYNSGSSVRQTMREVHIAGRVIPEDSTILMPRRHLLLAPEVFGPDAHLVNPYRFLRNKKLERHEYYEPWGQGTTRCSGKAIGRFEVLCFVAWTLWRYDIKAVGPGEKARDGTKGMRVPRMDIKKPSLGISKQVEKDDMIVEVRPRVS